MISENNYKEIVNMLSKETKSESIILEKFHSRILKINQNLNLSEEERFNQLKKLVFSDSKDIKDILYLISMLPEQVNVNRQILVNYIWGMVNQ